MVIHAGGGEATVDIDPKQVKIVLTDHGPGIPDVEKAMQEAGALRLITCAILASARGWACRTSKNIPTSSALTPK